MAAPQQSELVGFLRDLIRCDTSNPPGNERPAVDYLDAVFKKEGFDTVIVEPAPRRANIVTRLKGDGSKRPLLLSAHLDVVPALEPGWKQPAFSGAVHDGYIWGRGAVDMKHMAAMSLWTLLELKRKKVRLARDVIFAGVADEEAGGRFGAGYLVDHRRDLIDAEFCLTELGGMAVPMNGRFLVPVQVAQKGYVWFRLKAKGQAGHGSRPKPGSAVEKLAAAVHKLSTQGLEYRLTASTRAFLDGVRSLQSPLHSAALKGLYSAGTAGTTLKLLPEERRSVFYAMLHNTASVTGLSAGVKVNVIPGEATAEVDGRFLPGVTQAQYLDQVRAVVGPDVELEPFDSAEPLEIEHQSELWDVIERVMTRRLKNVKVVPNMIPGMTDAKDFDRAGIKTYGFAPVALEADEPFADLYHAPNERISVAGFQVGASWLHEVVKEFCAA